MVKYKNIKNELDQQLVLLGNKMGLDYKILKNKKNRIMNTNAKAGSVDRISIVSRFI